MFRIKPLLIPEPFRWLKGLRLRASLLGFDIPQPVREGLEAMNDIEDPLDASAGDRMLRRTSASVRGKVFSSPSLVGVSESSRRLKDGAHDEARHAAQPVEDNSTLSKWADNMQQLGIDPRFLTCEIGETARLGTRILPVPDNSPTVAGMPRQGRALSDPGDPGILRAEDDVYANDPADLSERRSDYVDE
jgi:hypothetical protein